MIERFPRKNILTSLLWLTGITLPTGVASATVSASFAAYIALGLGVLSFVTTLACYIFWMIRDPDRLQSEEFQLQQAYLTNLPTNLPYDEKQLPSISQQQVKTISASEGGK